jgi:hypothetical protein
MVCWDPERLGHRRLAVLKHDEAHALGGKPRAVRIELAEVRAGI